VETHSDTMIRVGIRELKRRASELVHMVHETGKEVQVTYRGQVVALLIPVKRTQKDEKNAWTKLDHLAAEIGARWPEGTSAAEAVSEARR
jgi:prevent-host-death family protein